MVSRECIDQLGVDPAAVFRALDTALEYIAHAEFLRDLAYRHRFTLVGERRVARAHEKLRDLGQHRDDAVGHSVDEVILLGVSRHVVERQHRNRRLVRQRERHALDGRRLFSRHPWLPPREASNNQDEERNGTRRPQACRLTGLRLP